MQNKYDWAAEMIKIAESEEHQKSMEKLAFSRDGKEEPSEVEEEMMKLAHEDCGCKEDCGDDCDCDCHDEKKEASASLEDTAGLLLEISEELEDQGMERLAAATIVLADNILKTAADKKKKKDKKSDKKSGKKMSMKERMEKMRAAQKGKKKDKSKSESKSKEEKSSK